MNVVRPHQQPEIEQRHADRERDEPARRAAFRADSSLKQPPDGERTEQRAAPRQRFGEPRAGRVRIHAAQLERAPQEIAECPDEA
jgi:hypothetical protein